MKDASAVVSNEGGVEDERDFRYVRMISRPKGGVDVDTLVGVVGDVTANQNDGFVAFPQVVFSELREIPG